jgi:L-alanine-DL-glutamate epimerase-like enolase superfamily enzyme
MAVSRKDFLKMFGLGVASAGFFHKESFASEKLDGAKAATRKMKITGIDIYKYDVPLKSPFRISLGAVSAANDVLIMVRTDSGLVGIGEACPFPPITGETQDTNLSMAKSLREMFIGKDPLAIESLVTEMGAVVHSNPSVVAAYDTALFDILGQAAGLPVFRLLGGDKAVFETDVTTGIDTPAAMAANAKEHAGRGYKTLKAKVGLNPDDDIARIQAIRDAIGPDINLRIDANQGWSVPQAIYALRHMEKFHIQLVEQPVVSWDTAGLKAVRSESPIPIMADEAIFLPSDAIKLIKADACDHFNIKLMKAGGILNSVRIAHIADGANIRCMVGCMLETRLGLTAAAHVVASQKNIIYADLDGNDEHVFDPVTGGMTVKGGVLTMPEVPGIGCGIDPAFLKKLAKI